MCRMKKAHTPERKKKNNAKVIFSNTDVVILQGGWLERKFTKGSFSLPSSSLQMHHRTDEIINKEERLPILVLIF